ncbi:MAG: hydroxyethylthiazole kinase [Candidatus Caldatribacteriaceae bacterium]
MEEDLKEKCLAVFRRIQASNPLVHHITNLVVANDNANTMLAVGALPVMAYAEEEVEEMVAAAQALVINIGTLTREVVRSSILAGKRANMLGIPVVFDPVGVGATAFRTASAQTILQEVRVAVVRGNASEVAALLGRRAPIRGVESSGEIPDVALLAGEAARRFGATVAVTGKIDLVSDGERIIRIENGDVLLTRVTGTGCMATSLCGACVAVEEDASLAASAALGFLGVCAEIAALSSHGPGSFRYALFDTMYSLSEEEFLQRLRIEVI